MKLFRFLVNLVYRLAKIGIRVIVVGTVFYVSLTLLGAVLIWLGFPPLQRWSEGVGPQLAHVLTPSTGVGILVVLVACVLGVALVMLAHVCETIQTLWKDS